MDGGGTIDPGMDGGGSKIVSGTKGRGWDGPGMEPLYEAPPVSCIPYPDGGGSMDGGGRIV
jgi:hypothetical protein